MCNVFCASIDHFIPVLLAFIELGLLVSLETSPENGFEERFRNDLICVEWDIKP